MFVLVSIYLQGAVGVLSENSYAQFYGKFRSSAPKVKVSISMLVPRASCGMCIYLSQALMKEIELRADNATE